ncbi:MAG: hypothetical protein ABH882_01030 [Candidatus Omnitrophota bacterium]|nr:hypothetical protein [Candidatus Omnitrophota bacterium]MBU1929499.1 hypothetical protein [Candidatus Omnitrophota bacterium]MBU2035154.1 hypothetical protein [Candidatus Omnitrophota bacterium]MBU2222064.1 hypothetical protein [Candidatus Omnitrophota bacterium]MBU2257802.1 hypothetical protein [Candidatus Omnitrophota bacterium]
MTKDVKQLIVMGVLVLVLIFAVLNSFKKKPVKNKSSAFKPPVESAVDKKSLSPGVGISMDNKGLILQKQRMDLDWGRDPFNTAVDKEFQLADLRLKGISFSRDKQGYAFINNEIVKKGDRVGNYEVVEVEKDKVLLRKAGQSFYLAFPQE